MNAAAVGDEFFVNIDGGWGERLPLTLNWQTYTFTKAVWENANVSILTRIDNGGAADDEYVISAAQFVNSLVASPFCLNSRTACTMTIPTATIGLTAGMPLTIMCVVNTPWAGNDGVGHYLFDAKGAGAGDVFSIYKHTDNKLYFAVGNKSAATSALTTTTWPANTNRFIIGTVSAAGTIDVYLTGAAGTQATGATREAAFDANTYIGSVIDGTLTVNGAILTALWGRVLSAAEIAALSAPATWAGVIDLPQITVTGLDTGNAVRLYDAAGNVHASAVEAGGTATLTYTLD
jgi:hypothetical protein